VSPEYEVLASAIIQAGDADFDEKRLIATVEDDNSQIEVVHIKGTTEKYLQIDTRAGWESHKALVSLRRSMAVPGQQPWSKCVFTLFPDGRFKFDVSYDD